MGLKKITFSVVSKHPRVFLMLRDCDIRIRGEIE